MPTLLVSKVSHPKLRVLTAELSHSGSLDAVQRVFNASWMATFLGGNVDHFLLCV